MGLTDTIARVQALQSMLGLQPPAAITPTPLEAQEAFTRALQSSSGEHTTTSLPPTVGGATPAFGMQGGSVGEHMLFLAQREVGVREEPPGSNDGARIREYRSATVGAESTPGPWCAYFVSWLARQAGAPVGDNGAGTGWVPALLQWGQGTGRADTDMRNARAGDVIVFDRNGDGVTDHIGIIESVSGGRINTIEGNSSNAVSRRSYDATNATLHSLVHM